VFGLGLSSLVGCGTGSYPPPESPIPRTQLRVALFPYIPDAAADTFRALTDSLERRFERKHPQVDLVLRPLNPADDFYDFDTLKQWLHQQPDTLGYHVVEVDALLLGELADSGYIAPWAADDRDWHPASLPAVTHAGTRYGIPHWLCNFFVISAAADVTAAENVGDLIAALRAAPEGRARLVGDLQGSWELPTQYLDAWADTHGPGGLGSAITPALEPAVVAPFAALAKECAQGTANPCLDRYDDNELAPIALASKEAHALIGYSERLHVVLRESPHLRDSLGIATAPMGGGNEPVVFVDALVRRSDCDRACQRASDAFSAFLNDPATHEWILMSRDAPGPGVPRYVIPATKSAFTTPGLRNDRFYRMIQEQLRGAAPFPNHGLREVRRTMRDRLVEAIRN
jgi:thiamine pyridinylase